MLLALGFPYEPASPALKKGVLFVRPNVAVPRAPDLADVTRPTSRSGRHRCAHRGALSEPIAALLVVGDSHGLYFPRSEAVTATALAAACAGWTEAVWRDVLAGSALSGWAAQRRGTGGALPQPGRRRQAPHNHLGKAVRRAHERPPATASEVFGLARRQASTARRASGVSTPQPINCSVSALGEAS